MATKSRGGRPRRSQEALQRITFNLKPSVLFGLELVSRDRRTSLSQAAEFLLGAQLKVYMYAGAPVLSSLERVTALLLKSSRTEHDGVPDPDSTRASLTTEDQLQALLLGSRGGRALLIPDFLRTPSESYFVDAFTHLANTVRDDELQAISSVFEPALMDDLYDEALTLEEDGAPRTVATKVLCESALAGLRRRSQVSPEEEE